MELRLPAVQGGILLMRSLAVHPLSFFGFFSPLYNNSWSFANTASELSPPPPTSGFRTGSEEEDAIVVTIKTLTLAVAETERDEKCKAQRMKWFCFFVGFCFHCGAGKSSSEYVQFVLWPKWRKSLFFDRNDGNVLDAFGNDEWGVWCVVNFKILLG